MEYRPEGVIAVADPERYGRASNRLGFERLSAGRGLNQRTIKAVLRGRRVRRTTLLVEVLLIDRVERPSED